MLEAVLSIVALWGSCGVWYLLGRQSGYRDGYRTGAAEKRAEIVDGFNALLEREDIKLYARKGLEETPTPAEIWIGPDKLGPKEATH